MNITKLNVLDIKTKNVQKPQLGGGGVSNSYAEAQGTVFVDKIEVDRFYFPELSYQIFDNNGDTDAFGDPLISVSGNTYLTDTEGKYFIIVEQTLEGIADPTSGDMKFSIQFTNAEEDIGIPLDVTLIVPNRDIVEEVEETSPAGPIYDSSGVCGTGLIDTSSVCDTNVTYPGQALASSGCVSPTTVCGCQVERPPVRGASISTDEIGPSVPQPPPSPPPTPSAGSSGYPQAPGAGNRQDVDEIAATRCGDSDSQEKIVRAAAIAVADTNTPTVEETKAIEEYITSTPQESGSYEISYNEEELKTEIESANPRKGLFDTVVKNPEIESTATTEEEYLGTADDSSSKTTDDSSARVGAIGGKGVNYIIVSTGEELKNALGKTSNIFILSDEVITLDEFTVIPNNTGIRGVNNPTIESTAGAAFSIKEDNITLTGFTLKNAEGNNGYGIDIGRKPNRSSLDAPKNITIDSITFDGIAGPTDKAAAINISGYQFVNTLVGPVKEVPGLKEGAKSIEGVKIINNVFRNIPNTAIEAWNAKDITIESNIFESTRGATTMRGNAIRANSLIDAKIVSNTLKDIGRSGIEITGNGTVGVLIEDNEILQFGTQGNLTKTFTSGITVVQGANEVTIKNNVIEGSGKGGGIEMAQNSSNFLIENNTISNVNKGIAVSAHSDSFNIKNNNINYLQYGIQLYQVWNGVINSNNISQPDSPSVANPAISVEQSNGITTTQNEIKGDFFLDNDEKAILVFGNYPTSASKLLYAGSDKQAMLDYAQGNPSVYNEVYKPPSSKVTDVIANVFEDNKLDGDPDSRVFFSQSSRVILPSGEAGSIGTVLTSDLIQKDNITYPNTTYDKVVGNESGISCKNLVDVLSDSLVTSASETGISTVLIEEDNVKDTITFTSTEKVEVINKKDLDLITIDVNPKYGYCTACDFLFFTEPAKEACINSLVQNFNNSSCGSNCTTTTTPTRSTQSACQVERTITVDNSALPSTCTNTACEIERTIIVSNCTVNTCDTICNTSIGAKGPTICKTIDVTSLPGPETCLPPIIVDQDTAIDICYRGPTTCITDTTQDACTGQVPRTTICLPGPFDTSTTTICLPGPTTCFPGPTTCIPSGEVCLPGESTVCLPGEGKVCLPKGGSVCLPDGGQVCMLVCGTVSTSEGCQSNVSKGCKTIVPGGGTVCLPEGGCVCLPGGGTVCITQGGCVCAPGPTIIAGTCLFPDGIVCFPGPTTCIPDTTTCFPGTTTTCIPDTTICFPGPTTCIPDTTTCFPGPTTCIPDTTTCFPGTTTSTCDTPKCIPGPSCDTCCDPGCISGPGITCIPPNRIIPPTVDTPFIDLVPTPVYIDPPEIEFPPPIIFTPPPEIPPFIPADCGKPPTPRVGVPVGEDPIVPDIPDQQPQPEQPETVEVILLYPAPVSPLTAPFLSNINFDTNITKKVPTPYSFEVEEDIPTTPTQSTQTAAQKQELCDEEEDCDKLGF